MFYYVCSELSRLSAIFYFDFVQEVYEKTVWSCFTMSDNAYFRVFLSDFAVFYCLSFTACFVLPTGVRNDFYYWKNNYS